METEQITGALTGIATGSTQPANSAGDLGFDTFLKLLVTQIANQDPLNPMDGTEFTEQLATFSSLEQQMASNAHLEKLAEGEDFGEQALAVSYIGKDVLVPSGADNSPGKVTLTDQGTAEFAYHMKENVRSNQIEIRNAQGELVRTLDAENSKGIHNVVWDGQDEAGNTLPAGEYTVAVKPLREDGSKGDVQMYTFGRVDAVTAQKDDRSLNLQDGRNVAFDSVLQVRANNQQDES